MGCHSFDLSCLDFRKVTNVRKVLLTTFAFIVLATCSKQDGSPPPAPQQISDSAISHCCNMNLAEHSSPETQISLGGKPERLAWFSTIGQILGYIELPEEPKGVHAIYIIDMGKVKD